MRGSAASGTQLLPSVQVRQDHQENGQGVRNYVEEKGYLDGSLSQLLDLCQLLERDVKCGSLYLGPALFDFRQLSADASCVHPAAVFNNFVLINGRDVRREFKENVRPSLPMEGFCLSSSSTPAAAAPSLTLLAGRLCSVRRDATDVERLASLLRLGEPSTAASVLGATTRTSGAMSEKGCLGDVSASAPVARC